MLSHTFSMLWVWLLFLIVTDASIIPRTTPSRRQPVIRDVWQFPNNTWPENLAVRASGQLLVTLLSIPELYQVDPTGAQQAQLIYHFPNATGLTGITEVEKDVFVVISGNFSLATFSSTPGSYFSCQLICCATCLLVNHTRLILGLESRHANTLFQCDSHQNR
jgi:hypothetical protein